MSRRNRNKGSKPSFTVLDEPYLIGRTLAAGTPLGQAMHQYNQAQLGRVWDTTDKTVTEENPVPLQSAPPLPDEPRVNPTVQELSNRLTSLEEVVRSQGEMIDVLLAEVGRPTADALNERIVAFLTSVPGIKFSPTSISENIGADSNARVADRLATMAKNGRVVCHKQEGRRPLYSVPIS